MNLKPENILTVLIHALRVRKQTHEPVAAQEKAHDLKYFLNLVEAASNSCAFTFNESFIVERCGANAVAVLGECAEKHAVEVFRDECAACAMSLLRNADRDCPRYVSIEYSNVTCRMICLAFSASSSLLMLQPICPLVYWFDPSEVRS